MQHTAHKTVSAAPDTVWAVLADHAGMASWAPRLSVSVEPAPTGDPNGVGALRTIKGPLPLPPIVEEITVFEPEQRLAYVARSGVPLKDYSGEVTLVASETGTAISYTVRATRRIPGLDDALVRIIATQLLGMVAGAVKRYR